MGGLVSRTAAAAASMDDMDRAIQADMDRALDAMDRAIQAGAGPAEAGAVQDAAIAGDWAAVEQQIAALGGVTASQAVPPSEAQINDDFEAARAELASTRAAGREPCIFGPADEQRARTAAAEALTSESFSSPMARTTAPGPGEMRRRNGPVVKCRQPGCAEVIPYDDRPEHEQACLHRMVQCGEEDCDGVCQRIGPTLCWAGQSLAGYRS